jgi:hypothetical protein
MAGFGALVGAGSVQAVAGTRIDVAARVGIAVESHAVYNWVVAGESE